MKKIFQLLIVLLMASLLVGCSKSQSQIEFTNVYDAGDSNYELIKANNELYNRVNNFIVTDRFNEKFDCAQDSEKMKGLDLVMVAIGSHVKETISHVTFKYDDESNVWTASVNILGNDDQSKPNFIFKFDNENHILTKELEVLSAENVFVFPEATFKITVHFNDGTDQLYKPIELNYEADLKNSLIDWFYSLELKKISYEQSNVAECENSSSYLIKIGEDYSIAYISMCGEYIVIGKEWYEILNPSAFPIEESMFEKR